MLSGFNNFVWNLDKRLFDENQKSLEGAILPTHIYFPDKNNTKRACVVKATKKKKNGWLIKELKKEGGKFKWVDLNIDWKSLAEIKKEDIDAVKKHHFQSLDFNRIMSGGKTNILFIPSSYTTTCRTGLLIPYNIKVEKNKYKKVGKNKYKKHEIGMIADLRRLISPYSAVIEMQLFIGQEKNLFFRANPQTADIAKRFSVWMNANPKLDDLTKSYQFISFYFPDHKHRRIGLIRDKIRDNDQYYYHACNKEGKVTEKEFDSSVNNISNEILEKNDHIVIKHITSESDLITGNAKIFRGKYSLLYVVPVQPTDEEKVLYDKKELSYSFYKSDKSDKSKGFLFYRTRRGIKTLVAVIFIRSGSEIKVTGEDLWHCLLKYFFLAYDDSKLDCRQWLKELAESYRTNKNKVEGISGWHPNNFLSDLDKKQKSEFEQYTDFKLPKNLNETKALCCWRSGCDTSDIKYIKKEGTVDKISVENAVGFLKTIARNEKYTFEAAENMENEQFFFPFFGEHCYGFEYALALIEFLDVLASEISKKKKKPPVVTLSGNGTNCSIKISADFFNEGAEEFVKKMRCQYWLEHGGCSRKFHDLVYVKYDQWQDAPNCEYRVDEKSEPNLIISW